MHIDSFFNKIFGEWVQAAMTPASIQFRIILAFILSAIVGGERAIRRHPAGLRTFIVVGVGFVLVAICDQYMQFSGHYRLPLLSASAIISQAIITSNSILFSSKNQLKGLTTTVGLWGIGIISLCLGFCLYDIAITGFLIMVSCILLLPSLEKYIKRHSKLFTIHVELESKNNLQTFIVTLRKFGLRIEEMEYNPAFANTGLGVYTLLLFTENGLKEQSHAQIIQALAQLNYVRFIEEI